MATGNWGCGAFGNDHVLKFLQQWLAASDAGVARLCYHTYGDRRSDGLGALTQRLRACTVGDVWAAVLSAAQQCTQPGPGVIAKFHGLMEERAQELEAQQNQNLSIDPHSHQR